ncbi:HAD family acid phosphatase [Amycolatopsis sp. PS_44_ISF1]|uniref:HAD family acid phosphatase n=1 Tax=Amycolatopsis sp. PS_44_ISF1 TaxID=2974917 RepID=UPI0028E080D5|nr:HAD family acid phosphatase [Amycolatopsis sp. PS_44_ISF1]MDT8914964.1 acid phosphatase [Amycolatopsis sp. PS_44_ISF1]
MRAPRIGPFAAAALACVTLGTGLAAPAAAGSLPGFDTWLADVHQAMSGGTQYLDDRTQRGGSKLAIVTDIDNTALETYYRPGHATQDVLDFAEHAKSLGVSVLVASYRSDASDAKNALTGVGYPVDRVCVRTSGEKHATDTKQRCRKEYAAAGYTIIANVGNRPGDFTGGNYEKGFKLPDYDEQLS